MYHGNLAASLAGRLGEGRVSVTWNIRQCLYDLKPEKVLTRQVIRANRFLSGKVGAVIYNCELARIQHEAFGFASAHGHVIPNGFDPEALPSPGNENVLPRVTSGEPSTLATLPLSPVKDHVSF
jgi:hypothetical protein